MSKTAVYAPPLVFGPWTNVANAIGSVTFSISVEQTGNVSTLIMGEVKYFTDAGEKVDSFRDSITIHNGNSVNSIDVRLKGVPTGSACNVTVAP